MANIPQLNPLKTEVMWCSSAQRQHQVPLGPVLIGNTSVTTLTSVRDIGMYINSDVKLSTHISAEDRMCPAVLRQTRNVCQPLTCDALITRRRAFVISKVD